MQPIRTEHVTEPTLPLTLTATVKVIQRVPQKLIPMPRFDLLDDEEPWICRSID
ncbi:MAG: hypothetical protein NT062_03635 [Proteobacteria bacterium]|nr:hypothetical protein [Pseudomonadota bacterium]